MDICLEDKASLSRAISYLEAKGCVECDSKQKKRYNSPFRLTDKGLKIAKSISEKIDNILNFASTGLNDKERISLHKSLTLISNNLDKFCDKYEVKN